MRSLAGGTVGRSNVGIVSLDFDVYFGWFGGGVVVGLGVLVAVVDVDVGGTFFIGRRDLDVVVSVVSGSASVFANSVSSRIVSISGFVCMSRRGENES